jgi:hypothetical protein
MFAYGIAETGDVFRNFSVVYRAFSIGRRAACRFWPTRRPGRAGSGFKVLAVAGKRSLEAASRHQVDGDSPNLSVGFLHS